jgi:two-component system sensor histidine kinase HydH
MKITVKTASLITALLCWVVCSGLALFIIWGMRDRARLIRDNDNEQIFNMLFASLRSYDDFGSAVDSNPVLKDRIIGLAVYDTDLLPVYSWGNFPAVFDEGMLRDQTISRYGRYTIPDLQRQSARFVIRFERMGPQPPRREDEQRREGDERRERPREQDGSRQGLWFFNVLSRGTYLYIDIHHPAYWRTYILTLILLPLCILALLVLFLYIRNLYLRNREYQERIEAQKNLVVLGTAASTLAHEIKNPLLSIRLQTGILNKILPGEGQEETAIINEEVERISALIYRVNDYLREPRGNPEPVNVYALLFETGTRLCDRDILTEDSIRDAVVFMDTERLRSVLENVVRNAQESGSALEEIRAAVVRPQQAGGSAKGAFTISILDRGKGVGGEDLKRLFNPFFTRKSTGTGIGLSISRRFIEAAGGTIDLENRKDGGAEVKIILDEYQAE